MLNSFTLFSTLIKMLKNTEKKTSVGCGRTPYTGVHAPLRVPCVLFCLSTVTVWQNNICKIVLSMLCWWPGQGWEPRNIFLIVCVYMDQWPAAGAHPPAAHLCHASVTHLVSRVTSCHCTWHSHHTAQLRLWATVYRLQAWLQGKTIIQSPEWSIPSHQNKHGLIKNNKNNSLALEQDITMVPSARLLLPRSKISQDNCIYPINWCSVLYLLMLQNSSQYGYNSQLILFFTKALEV